MDTVTIGVDRYLKGLPLTGDSVRVGISAAGRLQGCNFVPGERYVMYVVHCGASCFELAPSVRAGIAGDVATLCGSGATLGAAAMLDSIAAWASDASLESLVARSSDVLYVEVQSTEARHTGGNATKVRRGGAATFQVLRVLTPATALVPGSVMSVDPPPRQNVFCPLMYRAELFPGTRGYLFLRRDPQADRYTMTEPLASFWLEDGAVCGVPVPRGYCSSSQGLGATVPTSAIGDALARRR